MAELELDEKEQGEGAAAPSLPVDPELEAMFKAGLHFGYSQTRRHPKMEPYLFGMRNNVEIFDLEKTRVKLNEAISYIKELKNKNKVMVIVGTKPQIQDLVQKAGGETGLPYVSRRWIGGLLTNFDIIRKRIDHFESLKQQRTSGTLEGKYTKKEINDIDKDLIKLEANFSGVVQLRKLPDALFIIDPKEESTALREAKRLDIPVIALASSDADPESAGYLIPGNDSARASVVYILDKVVGAWKN
ncbi:MAG: 30S ribosomal protein S2 [Patescibacteria group bacterium]